MAIKWEKIEVFSKGTSLARTVLLLFRAKVPGGWFVKAPGGDMVFIQDAGHIWDGSQTWERLEVQKVRGFVGSGILLSMFRSRVPGGWLVTSMPGNLASVTSLAFYPDPDHTWDGSSLP